MNKTYIFSPVIVLRVLLSIVENTVQSVVNVHVVHANMPFYLASVFKSLIPVANCE